MRQQTQLVCTQYHACHVVCVVCHVSRHTNHVSCVTQDKSSTLREFSLREFSLLRIIIRTVSLAFWWRHLPTG
jgi:hypothetical protein